MYENYLAHYGVKGMKWGVRRYRPKGIRARVAKRANDKVDKGFDRWKEGVANRDAAISTGKNRNMLRMAYETNPSKENRNAYRQANKAYKKALRKNTTYRKGSVREDVGKDLSRKYLSEAKRIKKENDLEYNKQARKQYDKLMSKHEIERARARRVQSVAAARSNAKASIKRNAKIGVKSAALTGGLYALDRIVNNRNDSAVNVERMRHNAKKIKENLRFVNW